MGAFVMVAVMMALSIEFGHTSDFVYAGPSDTTEPTPTPIAGPKLYGIVLDHLLRPVQYASVSAWDDDSCPTGCGLSSTNTNGYWEADAASLQPGTYIFQAFGSSTGGTFEGKAFWTSHGSTTDISKAEQVAVLGDQNVELNFTLPGMGGLTWQVTDQSGEPIAYPEIVVAGPCSCNPVPLTGGQFGTYSMELPTGHYTISASAPGYVTTYWTASGGTSNPAMAEGVRICPSRTTVIGIRLPGNASAGPAGATAIPVPPPTNRCPAPYDYQSGTFVRVAATAGSSLLSIDDASAFEAGDLILISGSSGQAEVVDIDSKNFGTPSAQPQGHSLPGYLTIENPLRYSHVAGERVAELFNGDINCDGSRSLLDLTTFLLRMAESARTVPPGCPEIDDVNSLGKLFGDVDCDGDAGIEDALYFLAWWVDLPAEVPLVCS
jgi:hypothetical protein